MQVRASPARRAGLDRTVLSLAFYALRLRILTVVTIPGNFEGWPGGSVTGAGAQETK